MAEQITESRNPDGTTGVLSLECVSDAYCSVYSIRRADGLHKIGYSRKPVHSLQCLRVAEPQHLLLKARWVLDVKLARRVVRRCHAMLAGKELPGGWFQIGAAAMRNVIAEAAREEGVPIFSNVDLRRRIDKEFDRRIAKLLARM